MTRKPYKSLLFYILALILLLTACGSSSQNSNSVPAYDQARSESSVLGNNVSATSQNSMATEQKSTSELHLVSTQPIQQKLIYKGDLRIETALFDQTLAALLRSLNQADGYIVSQEDAHSQHAEYTTIEIRIPSSRFFTWVEGIEQLPDTTISKHIFTEDVSQEYVDLVARFESKQLVVEKYTEYMKLATTADELIRYTNELAHLQEELDAFQARIRYLDHQVSYSTVTLYIREITEASFFVNLGIGPKIKSAFEYGVTGFVSVVAFLITVIIILLPFTLLGFFVWYVIHIVRRNEKHRRITGNNHHENSEQPPSNQKKD